MFLLKPLVKEFQDDIELVQEVEQLSKQGVDKDRLYVLSHDDDRTKRIADKVNAQEIGIEETGLKVAVENMFSKKGDELRAKLEEIGFSQQEAESLEEKLDHGKILLLVMNEA